MCTCVCVRVRLCDTGGLMGDCKIAKKYVKVQGRRGGRGRENQRPSFSSPLGREADRWVEVEVHTALYVRTAPLSSFMYILSSFLSIIDGEHSSVAVMAVLYEDFRRNVASPGVNSGLMTELKIAHGDTPEQGDGAG